MRTNLCPNPSVGVDLTGWESNRPTSRVSVTGFARPNAVQITGDDGISTEYYILSAPGDVTVGNSYVVSVDYRVGANRDCTAYLIWYDDEGGVSGFAEHPDNPFTAVANTVSRLYISGTAPTGAARMGIQLSMVGGGDILQVTMAMQEEGTTQNAYADGDSAGWEWNGTAGLSTSSEVEVVDPPDPPTIDRTARWYLGVPGDLRELTCPEPGITTTNTRYGSVTQGLTGARRMSTAGLRANYGFQWTYMESSEWSWLEALYHRHIPGPHRLVNPLKKNRLTRDSASCKVSKSGLSVSGASSRARDWPSEADPGMESLRWTAWALNSYIRWDNRDMTVLFPEETVTASCYLKSVDGASVSLVLDYFALDGSSIDSTPRVPVTLTGEWQRVSATLSAPPEAVLVRMAVITEDGSGVPVLLAAAQLETGETATAWEQGGGACVALLDQLETTSPRFPLTDCTLTALEA